MPWVRRALGCGSGAPLKTYALLSGHRPIRCHASSAESTLMFAAATIAGIDVNDAEQMDGAELQL